MTLLGNAAVAMWWNVADEHLNEFQEWHSKEHLPERLSIPGFNRGSRWQRENTGEFFVIYELANYETLVSDAYLARLNNPTTRSTAMMPRHRDMVRSQCRVLVSHGQGVATYVSTIRFAPKNGRQGDVENHLRSVLAELPERLGITGAHLLRTETPEVAVTREQQIRGRDATADWIILLSGHNFAALRTICSAVLNERWLCDHGAETAAFDEPFRLVHALVPQDV